MAKEQSPSFSLYPKDFIADEHVVVMTMAQRGLYITLLCSCWLQGSIPNDPALIGRLCGATPKEIQATWPAVSKRFIADPNDPARLRHKRLDEEREKQAKWREKSAAGGRNGSAKRQPKVNHPSSLVNTNSNECFKLREENSKQETENANEAENPKTRKPAFDWSGWDATDFRSRFRALWDESGVASRLEMGCNEAVNLLVSMVDPPKAATAMLERSASWIEYYRSNGLSRRLTDWVSEGEYLANPPKPQPRVKPEAPMSPAAKEGW